MNHCENCIKSNDTCCATNYAHFLTLGDFRRIKKLGKKNFAKFSALTANDRKTELHRSRTHDYYYWLTRKGRLLQLKKKGGKCIFLDHKSMCRIYPARPLICRMYPFWYEKKNGRVKLIIDQNGRDSCPAVFSCSGIKNPHFSRMKCTKNYFLRTAKQLDREIEEYKKINPEEIRKLIKR